MWNGRQAIEMQVVIAMAHQKSRSIYGETILIHDFWLSNYSDSWGKSHSKLPECHFSADYCFKADIENFLKHNFLIGKVPTVIL